MAYKPEQGRLARMTAFWLIFLLVVYGCYSLRFTLDGWMSSENFTGTLTTVPVVGKVTINVLIAYLLIPALTAFVLIRSLNKPKIADFLIETEQELRKVAWPTGAETISAGTVVIITVLILAVFLAGSDFLLSKLFERMLS